MGFLFFGNDDEIKTTTKLEDISKGKDALRVFYNRAKSKFDVEYSYEEMIEKINSEKSHFIEGFGLGINSVNPTQQRLEDSMINVADVTKGQLPKDLYDFQKALSERLQKIDTQAVLDIASESATEAAKIAVTAAAGFSMYKALALAIPVILFFMSKGKK